MDSKHIAGILGRLFIALTLVAALAAFCLAQRAETTKPTRRGEIDSVEQARRAAKRAAQEEPTTGWLILDGKLIPGPYEIVIEDDCIKINGLPYMERRKPPEPTEKEEIDSIAITEHNLLNLLQDSFPIWHTEDGPEVAQQRALELMNGSELVDTAYFGSRLDLRVVFHGKRWPREPAHILLQSEIVSMPPYEEVRKGILKLRASQLRGWLNRGCLVMTKSSGGTIKSIQPRKAQIILNELQRIATTIPGLESRIAAVKEVISYDTMAELIAKEFVSE